MMMESGFFCSGNNAEDWREMGGKMGSFIIGIMLNNWRERTGFFYL